MFAFHETTRKRICRTGFFALCLAPTCATAAWIVDHHLPWRQSAAARRLSDRYHLNVELTGFREPRPDLLRTAAATIVDPHAAAPLLKLTGVETHHGETLALSIDEISLRVADLPALAERLEWSLRRSDARRLDLHIKQVTLNAPVITQLHQLRATIERDAAGKLRLRMLAHASATPAADAKPLGLSLETNATANADAASAAEHAVVTLDTQQNAIPVSLLAPLIPAAAAINETAAFTGIITWNSSQPLGSAATPMWEGVLRGELFGVDLATLIPWASSHKLQGAATLKLTDCRWRDARFTRLAGTLVANPDARLNGDFLCVARRYLGCRVGADYQELHAAAERFAVADLRLPRAEEDAALASAFHHLDRFACQFDLDAAGIVIAPCASPEDATGEAAEVLAVANGHPLLLAASDRQASTESGAFTPVRLPAASWLQFMANSTPQWLPFTPEAVETARRLPRPE